MAFPRLGNAIVLVNEIIRSLPNVAGYCADIGLVPRATLY